MCVKVGEPDKQLLVLVYAARIIGDDHRLPHSFDTQRLAEGAVRVVFASGIDEELPDATTDPLLRVQLAGTLFRVYRVS